MKIGFFNKKCSNSATYFVIKITCDFVTSIYTNIVQKGGFQLDTLDLSRWQFGITTVYHFFFVPLSIGLAYLIAVMQTMYVVKKDDTYKIMAKFWGKLFLLNFAVGVVTGIMQEFQFGMNWSDYSRFVGAVFGGPLAIEALVSFFSNRPSWGSGSSVGIGCRRKCIWHQSGLWRSERRYPLFGF